MLLTVVRILSHDIWQNLKTDHPIMLSTDELMRHSSSNVTSFNSWQQETASSALTYLSNNK